MSTLSLSFFRFHLARWRRTYPGTFAAATAAGLALSAALSLWAMEWQRAEGAEQAIQLLKRQAASPGPASDPQRQAQAALPAFDGAQFVAALHRVAAGSTLPVDEVSYVLDDSDNQPYLRYRVKLSVTASYPVIRRFVDRLRGELAHVSLDAISCKRDDIRDAEPSCDLALSAFYRKSGHG